MTGECSICFESIKENNIHVTECFHLYCIECFDKWKDSCQREVTCPTCRRVLETKLVINESYFGEEIPTEFQSLYTHVPPAVPYIETPAHFNLLISNLPGYFDGRGYDEGGIDDDYDENSITDYEVDEDYFEDDEEEDQYLDNINLTKKYANIHPDYDEDKDRREYREFMQWYQSH